MTRTLLLNLLTIIVSIVFFIKLFSLQVLNKDYDKLSQIMLLLKLRIIQNVDLFTIGKVGF